MNCYNERRHSGCTIGASIPNPYISDNMKKLKPGQYVLIDSQEKHEELAKANPTLKWRSGHTITGFRLGRYPFFAQIRIGAHQLSCWPIDKDATFEHQRAEMLKVNYGLKEVK